MLVDLPLSRPDLADSAAMRLVAAVQALSLARNLESVIAIVRTAARELSRADGATFILRQADECYYVDEDAISPLWKGQRFPVSACVSGWAMLNKQSVLIKDIYADARVPFAAYRPTFVRSLVMVPIRTEDPIGAIGIYWAEQHLASDFEIELLTALANTTSVALENVRIYEELEQRVADRTRQLEEANLELETFSYSASHDLQAPLRHINHYSSILLEDHRESLNEGAKDCVLRIQASARHTSGLIRDLLKLARFGRQEPQWEQVNVSQMAQEVVASLQVGSSPRELSLRIQPGMEASSDPALLRIALENLLGNAWKFTSKREITRIECGCVTEANKPPAYFVKDNGAGFDRASAPKLFAPFQRFHGGKDFPGFGIGLATVERIIHRHGGTIWAESAVDQGATFHFTLGVPANLLSAR